MKSMVKWNISARFKRYDAKAMMELAKMGGFPSLAKAWFLNVRAVGYLLQRRINWQRRWIDKNKAPRPKGYGFSETIESIRF